MKNEPVLIMTAIQAGISLAMSFGLGLTPQQTGAILAFSATIIGLITRQFVTPNSKV